MKLVKVKEDLTGVVFDRLTVIEQAEDYIKPNGKRIAQWLCECSCPEHNKVIVTQSNLKHKHTKSCGCLAIEKTSLKKHNKYDLSGSFGMLWSTNTNEKVYFDLQDSDKILQYTWWIAINGYPTTTINNKNITMHKLLGYYRPDHHNKNKLDNRRSNLISCTRQENQRNCTISKNNTSKFTGVCWDKNKNKWVAQIMVDYKNINLGRFVEKDDAIRARLQAEAKYFGEFAPQRHLFEQYNINESGGESDD